MKYNVSMYNFLLLTAVKVVFAEDSNGVKWRVTVHHHPMYISGIKLVEIVAH